MNMNMLIFLNFRNNLSMSIKVSSLSLLFGTARICFDSVTLKVIMNIMNIVCVESEWRKKWRWRSDDTWNSSQIKIINLLST
jgi:hypothetical protein